jgi:hypothetical protein
MFTLDNTLSPGGTYLQATISVAPSTLVRAFGEPTTCDEYKVSGEYLFEDCDGNVFTIYDWKSTSLYDDNLMSPSRFWAQDYECEINIGGKVCATEFLTWLSGRLSAYQEEA